ncbi:MAG: STAS domain-containing protein [Candidatus Omnitrophica bacterium]|nr:STAS domain-containing protein [Candidatus Omnitrophota bacterium]
MGGQTYEVEKIGQLAIFTLLLENITMLQNEELKRAFSALIDGGIKNIILDLTGITFVSSIVLASLVYMLKRAQEIGGNLVLCSVTHSVKAVLAATNLDKIFDIFNSRREAIEQFAHLF